MRIFLAGDYISGTGPANVTKYYIDNLDKNTLCQKMRSKIARVPEILINTIKADVVLYSGYSKQNILGMKFAKIIGKPTAYLMHGCVEYENEINREVSDTMCSVERKTLALTDMILAVSPGFAEWLRVNYSEYADKIDFVTNAIDDRIAHENESDEGVPRNNHRIMSIGGGMPRKKINNICKAIDMLRQSYDSELELVVIGAKGADTEEIDSYSFVDNKGLVPFKETKRLLKSSGLFIQNSCFETFGLAPVEAIACGCSVLCSKSVGALCLINGLTDADTINDCDNIVEIADKIRGLLDNSNNNRLYNGIDWENNSWKIRSRELEEKLSRLVR